MEDSPSVVVNKNATLIICVITHFLLASMISSVPVALPTIGKELFMEAALLGWVPNALNLTQVAVLLPAGRLADIYGRKKIFIYGMVIFFVSTSLCAVAHSALSLIAYRLFQGVGVAMAIGPGIAILTSVFPPPERGRALGLLMGSVYVGMSVGPFLGGVLTQHLGWRSIFIMGTFLCLVVLGLTFWKLKGEWAEARGEKFDLVGSIVLGLSLMAVLYGSTVVMTAPGIVLVLLGVLGLLAFAWWESRADSPILNLVLFRKNTAFIFSNLAVMIHYVTAFGVVFLISLYLQYNKGFSPQIAGLILITQPVVMAAIAPIAGRLSDRINPRKVAAIGMVINCMALSFFSTFNEATPTGFVVAVLAAYGLGVGVFTPPNTNVVMSSVATKFMGVASGTHGTMRSCGMALGMAVIVILFSIYIGEAEISPEYYPAFLRSFKAAFMICAALSFCGIFAQLAGRKTGRE